MKHLGYRATDRVTGFSGTITGFCTYLTGCNQYLVAPRCGEDGKHAEPHWLDEQRLVIDMDTPQLLLDSSGINGPDLLAPKR